MSDLLFVRDIKGDKQNIVYGRSDPYAIPKYRTAGNGFLLGLTRRFRLAKPTDQERHVINNADDQPGGRQRPLLSAVNQKGGQLLNSEAKDALDLIQSQSNYVSVGSGHSKKRRRTSNSSKSSTDSDNSSSTGDVATPPIEHEDSGYNAFLDDPLQARQRRLRDQILENPDNVEAWLALVEVQHDIVTEQNGGRSRSKAQKRLVIDLRLSILEEAVSRTQLGKTRLIPHLMREGAKVWDSERQTLEWEKLLKDHQSFDIRKLYIDFIQSAIPNFTVDRVVATYHDALSAITKSSDGRERDNQLVYVILRLTTFLHQSGFTERSISIWQALLEYNLFKPPALKLEDMRAAFEDFWDSEAARIGEPGATGWSGLPHEKEPARDPPPAALEGSNVLSSWNEIEEFISSQNTLPARTFDFTDDDDPYRVVLFQDVQQSLIKLTSESSRVILFNAFLFYVGLPAFVRDDNSLSWPLDPFLYSPHKLSSAIVPFTGVADTLALFEPPGGSFAAIDCSSRSGALRSWASRCLQLIVLAGPQPTYLKEICLAFEACQDPSSARKLARKLLKQSPDEIRLYNAYALLEVRQGNFDAAERVWTTSLASQSQGRALRPETACLWHSWIYSCILSDVHRAHRVLQRMSDDESLSANLSTVPVSPDAKLALPKSILNSAIDEARSTRNIESMSFLFDLLALAEYLSGNQDILSALVSYKTSISLMTIFTQDTSGSHNSHRAVELLHQHRARLIDTHIRKATKSFRPQIILDTLGESVEAFPNNSIFLTMFHTYRQKYGLIDRLRDLTRPEIPSGSLMMQYITSIQSELNRPDYAVSTEHSIRAAFLRAEENDSPVRTSPAIRLQHLKWEIDLLEKTQPTATTNTKQSAKRFNKKPLSSDALHALHSALQACPWLKQLYLTALSSPALYNALEPSGTRSLYNTMLDRGIRVRASTSPPHHLNP